MRRKKKRKKAFYQKVAEAILEGAPFDVSKVNGEGYKKVSELINRHMLRDLPEAERYVIWNDHLAQVDRELWQAVKYINDTVPHRHVHIHKPLGKRNIEFMSVIISYRQAGIRNADRAKRRAVGAVKSAVAEIRASDPKQLGLMERGIAGLLTG